MPLCRMHHTEQHTIGIATFVEKYSRVKLYLWDRGWSFMQLGDKIYLEHQDLGDFD